MKAISLLTDEPLNTPLHNMRLTHEVGHDAWLRAKASTP